MYPVFNAIIVLAMAAGLIPVGSDILFFLGNFLPI
jgi:hypothetical protein